MVEGSSGRQLAADRAPVAEQLRAGTWRLSGPARKVVVVVHIAAAGGWLGLALAMGILVATAATTDHRDTAAIALAALGMVAPWPVVVVGSLSLLSGVLLGLGSKYGLVRYWWVLTKLVLNLILVVLTVVLLGPGVREMSQAARDALTSGGSVPAVGTLIFPPVVSSSTLLVAMVLSVAKPWGRRGRAGRRELPVATRRR